ncbi:DtxR family transcriptional regulator [Sulfodiicoccus acidiphilus]|uniref:DtxR family transcriptional regulator n=1 Tax=Sulfodiicoccus acidiphilus TaxID=1670455 RepID=A0A830H1Y3_9CREN|nr:metal-dependent transcriptional regulator [Sulfodiicoccus acidiphilus]GGT96438.1 DtxR family transcriptional regulator [Sulfodiicoccus acidiphilus]
MKLSEPLENYLKEIYELEESKGRAKVVDLISSFNISPGTISKALFRLEQMGMIDRGEGGMRLTEDGRRVAERLVRAHRLSERLLTDVLGVDWVRSHELAHRLEHIWPEDVLDRIDEVLGRPRTCPHGHPISGRAKMNGELLANAVTGPYRVSAILKEEEWILRGADKLGLRPESAISVKREGDLIYLMQEGRDILVPTELAKQILVRAERDERA